MSKPGWRGSPSAAGRPQQSPTPTPTELELRVVEMRRRYPDWGARKLRVLLAREGVELTRSTLHRILLRRDLERICRPLDRRHVCDGEGCPKG